jgi:hypothetical protein
MVDFKLDHFKAYQVRENYQETVEIKDQFNEDWRPIRLGERTKFLTHVKKNVGEIKDHTAHLTWYNIIKPIPIKEIKIIYVNQFTNDKEEELIIDNLIGLLVPTRKHLDHGEFPEKLDHYTIYEVSKNINVNKDIVLRDQFEMSTFSKLTLYGFCVPCLKRREIDKEKIIDYQYNNPHEHLAIYNIPASKKPLNKKIETNNQFGYDSFIVLGQICLLVPTIKIKWSSETKKE